MRVLMLTNMYPHEADASFGTFVFEQVRALRARGIEVDVLFVNGRSSRWRYAEGFFRLWRQLAHVRYDLIHAHYVFSGWIARAQIGLPVVVSYHAPGESETYQGWLCRRLAPIVDAVIVTSRDHKIRLGYDQAQIIPCGVDFELFQPELRDLARAKLGWDAQRKVVAWIGDPRPEKRVDLAYAAYEELRLLRTDTDLQVIHKVPHEQIPIYMNAADALVLTSDHEGSPVTIKEAMACNLPIVAPDVGDVAEVFGDTEGYYLAQQTPQDLAAKLDLALDLNHRTQGRQAIEHLQTSGEAKRLVALYEKVLSRRGAGS